MPRAILPHHQHYLESLQTMQDMIQMMGVETYFLCVGAEAQHLAHICVRTHLCTPRWRLENDSKCFPPHLLLTSLTEPAAHCFARLADSESLRHVCLHPLNGGVTRKCLHAWLLLGDLNSGPQASAARALPAEPSP